MNIFVFHIQHTSVHLVDVSCRIDVSVRALLAKWLAALLACVLVDGRQLLPFAWSTLKIGCHVKSEFPLMAEKQTKNQYVDSKHHICNEIKTKEGRAKTSQSNMSCMSERQEVLNVLVI